MQAGEIPDTYKNIKTNEPIWLIFLSEPYPPIDGVPVITSSGRSTQLVVQKESPFKNFEKSPQVPGDATGIVDQASTQLEFSSSEWGLKTDDFDHLSDERSEESSEHSGKEM